MPGTQNFTQYGSDTFQRVIKFYEDDGTTPIDITGWAFAMQWKPAAGLSSTSKAALTISSGAIGGITLDVVSGNNQITITTIPAVKGGVYVYDLEITKPDGTVVTYLSGTITVTQDVTNTTLQK